MSNNIIDNEIYNNYIEAGKIHQKVMNETIKYIKIGMSLIEIAEFIENHTHKYGGCCAFPPNISINEVAAHFTPEMNDTRYIKKEDVIKIDIGVHINGYIADGARTISFSNKYDSLIKSSKDALKSAIEIIKPNISVSSIGNVIEETILSYGFKPIKNLMGHGLNKFIAHDNPSIPNYKNNDLSKVHEGQIIAIEPFATNGNGFVVNGKEKNIYSQISNKQTRNSSIRDVLNQIKRYNNLPFSTRWIHSDKLKYSISYLEKEKIITSYPILLEESNGIVSQFEHTIIINDNGVEIIT